MRSKGDVDIGAVAKQFGGGGHKNAAGCSVTGREVRDIRARVCVQGGDSRKRMHAQRPQPWRLDDSRPPDRLRRRARRRQARGVPVARRRGGRRAGPRWWRVGHTGTLDPIATGVLPLMVGRATRLGAVPDPDAQQAMGGSARPPTTTVTARRAERARRRLAWQSWIARPWEAAHVRRVRAAPTQLPPVLREEGRRRARVRPGAAAQGVVTLSRSRSPSKRWIWWL